MVDGIREIIESLEKQKTAIDNALEALRAVDEGGAPAPRSVGRPAGPAKRKGGMTPEGRKRLAEAMKRRWAVKRAASQVKATKKTGRKRAAKKQAAA